MSKKTTPFQNSMATFNLHQHDPNRNENQHMIWLATNEASRYFNSQMPYQKSLSATAIKHVGSLTKQAQKDSIYAIMKLAKWRNRIIHTNDQLRDKRNELEKALAEHIQQQRVHPPHRFMYRIGVGNQLVGMLVNTLTDYDKAIWLLGCASYAGLFDSINHYFQAKTRLTGKVNRLLSNIIHDKIRHIPRVTVMDYLTNAESYRKTKALYPDIKPTVLLQAIKTTTQLDYPAHKAHEILEKLTNYCKALKTNSS